MPRQPALPNTADLRAGLLSANATLLELFEAQARPLLDQLDEPGRVSRRVLDFLVHRMAGDVPALDEVADYRASRDCAWLSTRCASRLRLSLRSRYA
jgi:hypothetical protein